MDTGVPRERGSFSKFVNVMSSRTAVGHDQKGQLVLFHADGQTEQRAIVEPSAALSVCCSINLWETAEFLLIIGTHQIIGRVPPLPGQHVALPPPCVYCGVHT
ncbi:N-Acetylglucosamine-1-Phosphodiester Alpha-N-Acetylglucosaminidase [Manis pentadactyla]|nr:N-Acetylglucosamine-1-Phosphodiester Alpha-N-Acetylglucosaminidase [Manis pentadactyla]